MADETRQRLLEAAGSTFAEKGYDSATIREICQKAEANLAAVNYHFGDKERLYTAAVRQAHCVRMEEVPVPEWPATMPPEDRLCEYVRFMLTRMLVTDRPVWHLELMLRELARPTAACAEVVEEFIRPMAETLGGILAELLPAGTPKSENYLVGFSVVGQILFYYVHKPIIKLLIGEEEYATLTIERLAEHIARFSLAALGVRALFAKGATQEARA